MIDTEKEFYGSCHTHLDSSNYRLRDCIIKLEPLCEYALELGHNFVAITDHETVSSFLHCQEVEEEITFETTIKEDVDMYIEKGMSTKDAIKEVAKQRNLNKNSVYQEYHSK